MQIDILRVAESGQSAQRVASEEVGLGAICGAAKTATIGDGAGGIRGGSDGRMKSQLSSAESIAGGTRCRYRPFTAADGAARNRVLARGCRAGARFFVDSLSRYCSKSATASRSFSSNNGSYCAEFLPPPVGSGKRRDDVGATQTCEKARVRTIAGMTECQLSEYICIEVTRTAATLTDAHPSRDQGRRADARRRRGRARSCRAEGHSRDERVASWRLCYRSKEAEGVKSRESEGKRQSTRARETAFERNPLSDYSVFAYISVQLGTSCSSVA